MTLDLSRLPLLTSCRQAGPCERIWRSDSLIPSDLRDQLVAAVSPLENVPDREKDWHPRSDNKVLDLVRPSLYPLVYRHTLVKDLRTGKCKMSRPPKHLSYTISRKFQWLPSDFAIAEDGTVTLASPYIKTSIHRNTPHWNLSFQSCSSVPFRYGNVCFLICVDLLPLRVGTEVNISLPRCLFAMFDTLDHDSDDEYVTIRHAWLSKKDVKFPVAKEKYTGDLDVMKAPTVSLKGTTIQCIIKLANIVLTPEKPEYPGGKWHVEGQWVSTPVFFGHNRSLTKHRDEK